MRFQRVLLIVNPVARTVSKPTLAVIEKAMSADFRLEVTETKERGHASEIATQAVHDGIDLVVVFSGDGTINEVVNSLAGTETALGVLPGGATNILVRALGLPTEPVDATGVLIGKALDDEAFKLHLGRADGRYFAVNCGAGVDAAAMARMDAKFPKTKAKFDRVAFRSVAWELMVGYAGKTPRPGGLDRRRGDGAVTVGDGRAHRSVHVLQGAGSAHDAAGLARDRARRAEREEAGPAEPATHRRAGVRVGPPRAEPRHRLPPRRVPCARHLDRSLPGAGRWRLARRPRRLEIELAREALWVVA